MPGQRPCEVGIVGLLWYAGASLDLSVGVLLQEKIEEEMTLLAIKPTPNLFIPNEELPINQQLGYKNQLLEYLGLNNHCFEGSLFPYLFFGSAS